MKKELKDYLHLYLGCRIKSKGGKFGDLVSVSNDGMSIVVYDKDKINDPRGLCINSDWLLLILRPLSDITGDELIQYGKIEFPDMKGRFDLKGIREVAMHAYYEPETFKWLLSKNFDLFELIEAGLAIDKTTLK